MRSIVRHIRTTTIDTDQERGIIRIRDKRLTTQTVYPDEPDLDVEDDDIPPPWGDRFGYPPASRK
jgi:hypothetical protein